MTTQFLRSLLITSLVLASLSGLQAGDLSIFVYLRVITLPKATANLLLGRPELRTQPAKSLEILNRLLSEKKATLAGVLATQAHSGQRSTHSNASYHCELEPIQSNDGTRVDLALALQEAPNPGKNFPAKLITNVTLPRVGSQIIGAFDNMEAGPDGPTQIVLISIQ